MSTPRDASSVLFSVIVFALVVAMFAVYRAPWLFMVDDAWFYLQIGRNIGVHGWSTFDGLHGTDGYHPLWMGLVSMLALVSPEKAVLLNMSLALQMTLAPLTLIGVWQLGREQEVAFPEVAAVALLLTQYTDKGWMSEGPVTAFLHVIVLLLWTRERWAWTGAAMGALFLCRLDTVFFLTAIGLLTPRRAWPRIVGVAALVAGPWVLGHWAWTGHLVPVSGAIKSTLPIPDLSDPLAKLGWTGILAVVGSMAAGLVAWRRRDAKWSRMVGALAAGGALHGVYVGLFTGPRWSTFVAYYWITGVLATGFVLGPLLARYLDLLPSVPPARRRLLLHGLLGFLALSGAGRAVNSVVQNGEPDPSVRMAQWMRANLPPDSRILALDAPGRIAWFSDLPVVAMDGLTQPHTFSDDVRASGIQTWARETGITHVLTYAIPFDAPWCRIDVDGDALDVTFRAPDTRESVGRMHFDGEPTTTLSAFDDDATFSWASVYPLP